MLYSWVWHIRPWFVTCVIWYSLQEWIRNQRKTNNGEDFPPEFLTEMYHRIKWVSGSNSARPEVTEECNFNVRNCVHRSWHARSVVGLLENVVWFPESPTWQLLDLSCHFNPSSAFLPSSLPPFLPFSLPSSFIFSSSLPLSTHPSLPVLSSLSLLLGRMRSSCRMSTQESWGKTTSGR